MNLIEAVKSGRPFKRRSYNCFIVSRTDSMGPLELSRQDILADDWEVEEEKKEFTRTRIYEAVRNEVAGLHRLSDVNADAEMIAHNVCVELYKGK